MPTKRRLIVVIALFAIALAISLIYNAVQSTTKARLSSQNQSLEKELKNLKEFVRKELYPLPASAADITTGKDILTISQELHQRHVQIVSCDMILADSGWLVIDLPFGFLSQVPNLDITLFYRDQNGEKDQERTIYPVQSAKDCFNGEKQRLEIPVSRHLSSLCSLSLIHKNGTSWSFNIVDSKLVWKEN